MSDILGYFDLNNRVASGHEVITSQSGGIQGTISQPRSEYFGPLQESKLHNGIATERSGYYPRSVYSPYYENHPSRFNLIPSDFSKKAILQEVKKIPLWEQLLMYFGIVIGVIFSSCVMQFNSGEANLNLTIINIITATVIGLILIPIVFEKLSFKPDSPLLIRFGLFVEQGVFWYVPLSLNQAFIA